MDPTSRASRVIRALRKVNFEGSIFGQNVAIRFGLSESDIDALERLTELGATTAGHLAELMDLSTGAVTRVLDRLEQAGYIRRSPDPADRRRVIITLVADKTAGIEALTDRLARASETELARYTEDQLDAIADFLARMSDVTRAETSALRDAPGPAEDEASGEHGAPIGGLTSARLVLRGGANEFIVRAADAGLADLYRARFEGAVPQVRLRNGVVSVQYRGGRPWDWRKRSSEFALNPSIPWAISLTGGAASVSVDAGRLNLRAFELTGGVERVRLTLGVPRGESVIRIAGGSSEVQVDRPVGVPVRLSVRGGAGGIELDGQRVGGTGSADLATPGADRATDRLAIEVIGGTGRVTVGSDGPDTR